MTDRIQLAREIEDCAQLSGTFTLRSGATSDTYFDKYLFESSPGTLKRIAQEMALLLPPETEILAGLEMGGIPIVTILSQVTGLPAAFLRKEARHTAPASMLKAPLYRERK